MNLLKRDLHTKMSIEEVEPFHFQEARKKNLQPPCLETCINNFHYQLFVKTLRDDVRIFFILTAPLQSHFPRGWRLDQLRGGTRPR